MTNKTLCSIVFAAAALGSGCKVAAFSPSKPTKADISHEERAASSYVRPIKTTEGYEHFIKQGHGVLLVYDQLVSDVDVLSFIKHLAEKYPKVNFGMIRTDNVQAVRSALQGRRYEKPVVQVYDKDGQRIIEGTLVHAEQRPTEISRKYLESYLKPFSR